MLFKLLSLSFQTSPANPGKFVRGWNELANQENSTIPYAILKTVPSLSYFCGKESTVIAVTDEQAGVSL